jgi:hypothetical protein
MYFRASGMRAQTCAKLLEQVPPYGHARAVSTVLVTLLVVTGEAKLP